MPDCDDPEVLHAAFEELYGKEMPELVQQKEEKQESKSMPEPEPELEQDQKQKQKQEQEQKLPATN